MKQICEKSACTGCSACMNSCPKNCIEMKEDEYGILMPNIDENKCINCNLCIKKCPENNSIEFHIPLRVYAGWSLDKEERKKSASGGIAWEIYKYVINHEGIAVGTQYNENMNLVHKMTDTIEEVKKYKGSKYVQSYIGNLYIQIEEQLKRKKEVVFIGTPCQVSGLKSFLKNKDTSNLITVDLVCHGVPPIKYFKDYLKYLKIQNKIDNVTFRGENNRHFTAYKKEKIVYKRHSKEDVYYSAFLEGLFYRENCYQCRYAKKERVSDITIGDFWGLGDEIPFNHKIEDGVSLILVNTKKGDKLIQDIKSQIFIEARTIEEAQKGNEQLNHPSYKNKNAEVFKKLYKKYGFKVALENTLERGKLDEDRDIINAKGK